MPPKNTPRNRSTSKKRVSSRPNTSRSEGSKLKPKNQSSKAKNNQRGAKPPVPKFLASPTPKVVPFYEPNVHVKNLIQGVPESEQIPVKTYKEAFLLDDIGSPVWALDIESHVYKNDPEFRNWRDTCLKNEKSCNFKEKEKILQEGRRRVAKKINWLLKHPMQPSYDHKGRIIHPLRPPNLPINLFEKTDEDDPISIPDALKIIQEWTKKYYSEEDLERLSPEYQNYKAENKKYYETNLWLPPSAARHEQKLRQQAQERAMQEGKAWTTLDPRDRTAVESLREEYRQNYTQDWDLDDVLAKYSPEYKKYQQWRYTIPPQLSKARYDGLRDEYFKMFSHVLEVKNAGKSKWKIEEDKKKDKLREAYKYSMTKEGQQQKAEERLQKRATEEKERNEREQKRRTLSSKEAKLNSLKTNLEKLKTLKTIEPLVIELKYKRRIQHLIQQDLEKVLKKEGNGDFENEIDFLQKKLKKLENQGNSLQSQIDSQKFENETQIKEVQRQIDRITLEIETLSGKERQEQEQHEKKSSSKPKVWASIPSTEHVKKVRDIVFSVDLPTTQEENLNLQSPEIPSPRIQKRTSNSKSKKPSKSSKSRNSRKPRRTILSY